MKEDGKPITENRNDIEMSLTQTGKLLLRIEKIFTGKLSRKTGWGRNEVLVAYKDSVKEALMEMLD